MRTDETLPHEAIAPFVRPRALDWVCQDRASHGPFLLDMRSLAGAGRPARGHKPSHYAVWLLTAALLLGAALIAFPSSGISVAHSVLLAAAFVIAMGVAVSAVINLSLVGHRPMRRGDEVWNQRLETLEDLRWQARDDALHLQALLDAQAEIIIRRDRSGRVTFVNDAFCRTFGHARDTVIGHDFGPRILASEPRATDAVADSGLPAWARTEFTRIETTAGLRWIAWKHTRINSGNGETGDIQSVGQDVTEQRDHEAALAAARDAARAADSAKSRFLASMSHEIRTPMNGILGMAALLKDTGLTAEQLTYVDAVRTSSVTLLSLVDEILDFSKIEAGRLELERVPVDIVGCVQGVVELLAPRAAEKGLELAWSHAPDLNRVLLGDETRLRQIIFNLVGNAVKFTQQGGISIWLGAERASDARDNVQIVVRDTGPGLDDEARSRIFMEFERAVPASARQQSGTGLGLAIAQRLARRMGGDITVNSQPGVGSTFTLSVCLERDASVAAEDAMPTDAEWGLQGHRVLIISPLQIERRTVASYLRSNDLVVAETNTVAAAFPRMVEGASARDGTMSPSLMSPQTVFPETILIDSSVDVDAVRALAAAHPSGRIPKTVVIGTPQNRAELRQLRAAGIDHFLVRPIRPSTLLAVIAGKVEDDAESRIAAAAQFSRRNGRAGSNGSQHQSLGSETVARGWRVLLAEDNEINALLARTILARLGCEIVAVTDGQQAVEAVEASIGAVDSTMPASKPFDVVLMDLNMPVMDGLAATRQIRRVAEEAGRKVPYIVAVTANAFEEDRDRCLSVGMDDYLSKPFEPSDLVQVLERATHQRRIA